MAILKEIRVLTTNQTKLKRATVEEIEACLSEATEICIDTETTGLNPKIDKVLLIQVGTYDVSYVIDCTNTDPSFLFKYITDKTKRKLGHNLAFDYKMLKTNYGIEMCNIYDTMIIDQVLYCGMFNDLHPSSEKALGMYRRAFSLTTTVKRHLKMDIKEDKKLGKSFINYKGEITDKQYEYAGGDIIYPILIKRLQLPMLKEYQLGSCTKLECDAIIPIAEMELHGIEINYEGWLEVIKKYEKLYKEQEKVLDKYIEDEVLKGNKELKPYVKYGLQVDMFSTDLGRTVMINWGSPKTVLTVIRKFGIALPSTSADSLDDFKHSEPLIRDLITFRQYSKALSSYGHKFLTRVDRTTNRIHTNFNQLYPATGRLSSEQPNLQNIKRGGEFRQLFVASKDMSLITADYGGQELVLVAEASQEPVLLEIFRTGKDPHSYIASLLYKEDYELIKTAAKDRNHPLHEKYDTMRNATKTTNFGLVYGMSEYKLARKMGWTVEEAKEFMTMYFDLLPVLKRYLDRSGQFGMDNGYSLTLLPYQRIRWFKEHENARKNNDWGALQRIKRQAMNSPIQGTGADMIKLALVNIYERLKECPFPAKLTLSVHDEIVVEAYSLFAEVVRELVEEVMIETAKSFVKSVPMTVSTNISTVWSK